MEHLAPLLALAAAATLPATALAQDIAPLGAPLTAGEIAWGQIHTQVRSDRAHAAGHTGRGATVAVLDTGVQGSHVELYTQLSGTRMYDATLGKWVAPSDGEGHGTHVAGIVAGSTGTGYSYGIAPDAKILPIKVFFSDSGMATTSSLAKGLKAAAGKRAVSVINLSLGGDGPLGGGFESALRSAIAADKLIVAAAGNEAGEAPIWPARYAKESWARGQIIAVGAVDADNRLASFSNRAGDTANWYLVAPGVGVLSAYNAGGYAFMSGTSMATPVVSGAAALLEGTWPQLKASQVADILFQTATDLGEPGVDATYGRGLLNVERAMQPVGPLAVPTSRPSKKIRRASTTLRSSVASWSALHAAAREGQFRGIAVDAFNRDFQTDFGAAIRAPGTESLTDALDMAGRSLHFTEYHQADGSHFMATVEERRSDVHAAEPLRHRSLLASSAVFRLAAGQEFALATGSLAGSYFGLARVEGELGSPYLGLARAATQFAFGLERGGLILRAGVLDSGFNAAMNRQPSGEDVAGGRATVAELNYRVGPESQIGIQYATVTEANAWLGSVADDALALDSTDTRTITVHFTHPIAADAVLAARYSVGRTAGTNGEGLLSAASDVRSEAFAVGLVGRRALISEDRIALTLSSPVRITHGTATVSMPVAITANGETVFESRRLALAATSRELRLGLDYTRPLSRSSALSMLLSARHHANHVAGEQEVQAGLVYRASF